MCGAQCCCKVWDKNLGADLETAELSRKLNSKLPAKYCRGGGCGRKRWCQFLFWFGEVVVGRETGRGGRLRISPRGAAAYVVEPGM